MYRLYRLEGFNLRIKRKRCKSSPHREARILPKKVNECWSMDFVHDQLFNGKRIRFFTVVDIYSRECLAIGVGQRLTGEDVVEEVKAIAIERGNPQQIFVDNGSEFVSKALDKWAYEQQVTLEFSRPGTPTNNAFIESFNGSFKY